MFGSNAYPSRSYPEEPAIADTSYVGGARGPAAIPARILVNVPPAPEQLGAGAHGEISYHRGIVVSEPGRSPGLQNIGEVQNELGHANIRWSRPAYPNADGLDDYSPPTKMPNWTANRAENAGMPASPIPVQRKQITAFTVQEEYGSTRQLFNVILSASRGSGLQPGMNVQGRRWLAQAKTVNPWQPLIAEWGPAGSYGQTTRKLQTQPVNMAPVANASPYGAY